MKLTVTYDHATGRDVALLYAPCQDLMDLLHATFALEKALIDLAANLKSGEYTDSELRNPEGVSIRGNSTGVETFEKMKKDVNIQFKKPFAES
jgi:hypothetical protein